MKKIVVLLIAIAMCLVGCATSVTPVSLEDIENELSKDVTDTIDALNVEWEELKSETDTYDKYLENKDKVEDFYDKINESVEQMCIRLRKYTARYARAILSSNMANEDRRSSFDNLLERIYEEATSKLHDCIYEELLMDMKNTYYEGILGESNNSTSDPEWHDNRVTEYTNWYDTRIDVYDFYDETRIDIYGFYNNSMIDLWSDNIEGAKENLNKYEESIEK